MGNKPATTTTTQSQTRNPWDPAIAPLTGIINRSQALAGDMSNWTPTTSGQTMAGIQGLTDAANAGPTGGFEALNTVVGGSQRGFDTGLGTLTNAATGGTLNANPYLDDVINRTTNDIATRVNGQFTAGGRYGSGAHTATLAKEIGNTVGNMRLANYGTERAAQDNAARTLYGGGFTGAGFGTTLDNQAIRPALLNLQAGEIADRISNAERMAPMNAVQWQAGITNPIATMGGTSNSVGTSQTVQPTNWLTTGLGLGMSALGAMSGNPMAMANLGSNLGGLMSGLGGGGGTPWINPDNGLVWGGR